MKENAAVSHSFMLHSYSEHFVFCLSNTDYFTIAY